MDRELLDCKRAHERDDGAKPKDDKDILEDGGKNQEETAEDKPGTGEKAGKKNEEQLNLVETLDTVVGHFFPRLNEWLREITDIREQESIQYSRETLIWVGLIMMLTRRGSRKKITDEMRTDNFCSNLKELSGQADLENIPHGDTVEYLYTRMKVEELYQITAKMMGALFRARVLEKYRLMNKYHTVAIDGYQTHSFDYQHCEYCLKHERSNGQRRWFHYKLQASLVTPTGLCLPLASEWVENERKYDKQDCELKACYRLLEKLRKLYPQLPICVLLDSLYANQPMFDKLKSHRMEWITVFKEGTMPEAFKWAAFMSDEFGQRKKIVEREEKEIDLRYKRQHEERLVRNEAEHRKRKVTKETTYTLAKDIEHWDKKRVFNIMTCKEVEDGKVNCDYTWLVSDGLKLSRDNIKELAERGRCRWKIENEGINIQKNGGYNLEHLYSRDEVSIKIWDAVLNMAHLISQLMEKGSLIAIEVFGSIRNVANRMFEHFRYYLYVKPLNPPRIQIRLTWDTS